MNMFLYFRNQFKKLKWKLRFTNTFKLAIVGSKIIVENTISKNIVKEKNVNQRPVN